MRRDIVVIGASAGGIDALKKIVGALPAGFRAALFVVIHMAPNSPGVLGTILERAGRLPATMVTSRERFESGRIYVAAPDHHLLIDKDAVYATKGPKENRFRPAVDPLFRSAAKSYGPRVIGVILTGGLDDCTAGMIALKRLGGAAVVQDPDEAFSSSMPRNAMTHVQVDHCVRLVQMPSLLVRLAEEPIEDKGGLEVPEHINIEVSIAKEDDALAAGVLKLGPPSLYACPECHGVLLQMKEAGVLSFRCHTGHAYSVESLLAELHERKEEALWNAVRAVEEQILLMRHAADHCAAENKEERARELRQRADLTQEEIELVRRAVLRTGTPQAR